MPYFFHWANYIVGLDFTWMGHHRWIRKTSLLHHWQLWHPQDKYRILAARVLKPVFYTGFRGPEKFQSEFGNLKNILEAMAPHSSTLAWKIPWMEEPGRLQSMGSRRVGHDWATSLSLFTFMRWRRKWQPAPLPYSCLENPRDGGAWWAAVYGVAQSRTQLKQLSSSSSSSRMGISFLFFSFAFRFSSIHSYL